MNDIILSLTTHCKRWKYFNQALKSLLQQSAYDQVLKLEVNIDNDSPQQFIDDCFSLKDIDPKIEVNVCDKRWRSANKLIPTYMKHHDDFIVCFDDDKNYPVDCLKQLLDASAKHKDCIVAQEINPAVIDQNQNFKYLNSIDVKLEQEEFGKYLSNACLFPPNCFSDEIFNYENFYKLTHGNHDELWFWISSTLNKTKVVGLNNTFSYGSDENVTFDLDESSLTHINMMSDVISKYNKTLNDMYGDQLKKTLESEFIVFTLSKDNVLAFTGNIKWINSLYGNFNVKIKCDKSMVRSWMIFLMQHLKSCSWRKLVLEKC